MITNLVLKKLHPTDMCIFMLKSVMKYYLELEDLLQINKIYI